MCSPRRAALWLSLVAASDLGEEAQVEACLDLLVEADPARWNHPVQVLSRPRPELGALLAGCSKRLAGAGEDARGRLHDVRGKLERAVRIESNARMRRAGGQLPD